MKKFAFVFGCLGLFALAQVATYTTFAQWSSAPVPGTLSFASDSLIARYNQSSSTYTYFGPIFPISLVSQSGWSWVNQGTAAISTTGGVLAMQAIAASGDNLRSYVRSIPSTPFTITVLLMPNLAYVQYTNMCGVIFYESGSGKSVTAGIQMAGSGYTGTVFPYLGAWNSNTSYNTSVASPVSSYNSAAPLVVKVTDSGTTISYSYSSDKLNFISIGAATIATYFTSAPNEIGMTMDSNSNNFGTGATSACTVISWGN